MSEQFNPQQQYKTIWHRIPIAAALLENNPTAFAAAISKLLPHVATVSNIQLCKTLGESFTGGRSTPVYSVSCVVHRNSAKSKGAEHEGVERHWIVKLVTMTESPEMQCLRESYAVERRFYESETYQHLKNHLHLPKLVAADLDGTRSWPISCIVLNDVTKLKRRPFGEHPSSLTLEKARSAVHYLAHWHGACWGHDGKNEKSRVWELGGYWNAKRNCVEAGADKTAKTSIAAQWRETLSYLQNKHPDQVTEATKTMGRRLQAMSCDLRDLWSSNKAGVMKPFTTLCHGDFKPANIFFRSSTAIRDCDYKDDECSPDQQHDNVIAIDFQYTRYGLGAFDMAYFLYPDALNSFDENQEAALLEAYHNVLVQALIMYGKGGPSSYSFRLFQAHYHLVRLDLTCYWLANSGWVASTEGEARVLKELERVVDEIDTKLVGESGRGYKDALLRYLGEAVT